MYSVALDEVEIRDAAAAHDLCALLDEALKQLKPLCGDPVLLAHCPNRYNDVDVDGEMHAVQIGDHVWEHCRKLRERYSHPSDPMPDDFTSERIFGRKRDLRAARDVLDWLQEHDWRGLFGACLGEEFDHFDTVALAVQRGVPWLCLSSSNGDTEYAFGWDDPHGLRPLACCERIDERIGRGEPMWCSGFHPLIWETASPRYIDYFVPARLDAQTEFSLDPSFQSDLGACFGVLRGLQGTSVRLGEEPIVAMGLMGSSYDETSPRSPTFSFGRENHFKVFRGQDGNFDFGSIPVERHTAGMSVQAAAKYALQLWERAQGVRVLESAFGALMHEESVSLILDHDSNLLIFGYLAFDVDETGVLRFLGLADVPGCVKSYGVLHAIAPAKIHEVPVRED